MREENADKEKENKNTGEEDLGIRDVGNQVNNSRATICDITEAGDAPINMGIIPIWLSHKGNPN